MKIFAFLLFYSLSFFSAIAQKDIKFVLSLDDYQTEEKVSLPFSGVKVIDARLGHSNVGCVVNDLSFKGMTENKMLAVFPEELKIYLPKLLGKLVSFDNPVADSLVLLVKQFRIADHLTNTLDKYHEPESVLTFSISFYKADKNQITKIFSAEDVLAYKWTMTEKLKKYEIALLRTEALMNLLQSIFKNRDWAPTTTSFQITEVETALNKRFQLPVFNDTFLVAGLYKTFEEFQKNSPSVPDITIGRLNEDIMEVRDAAFTIISTGTFWGLCDGKNRYINFMGGTYQLHPFEKGFRLIFYRRESQKIIGTGDNVYANVPGAGIIAPVNLINSFKKNIRPEYLYLNMETGQIHVEEIAGTGSLRKAKK
jgi:hypothetical protein